MKEKLIRFMYGRYGVDAFSKFLIGIGFAFAIITMIINLPVLYYISLVLIIYAYFRMFSKNHPKRYAENQAYYKYTRGIRNSVSKLKYNLKQRRTHHIYSCPSCKQKIRIPKGKGKIEVRCPKCSNTFIKRS
ncbi:MAG: hypothetical protein ACRC3H_23190 [Lachnospiraceae bacterium]